MAILGLRSLYFALANVIHRFVYFSTGLAIILGFAGFKIIMVGIFKIPTFISLIVIGRIFTISIVFSLVKMKNPSESVESK